MVFEDAKAWTASDSKGVKDAIEVLNKHYTGDE